MTGKHGGFSAALDYQIKFPSDSHDYVSWLT